MSIFIASKWTNYEGSYVIGVYESLEAAQAVLKDEDLPEHELWWQAKNEFLRPDVTYWTASLGWYGGSGYKVEEWEVHPIGSLTD